MLSFGLKTVQPLIGRSDYTVEIIRWKNLPRRLEKSELEVTIAAPGTH